MLDTPVRNSADIANLVQRFRPYIARLLHKVEGQLLYSTADFDEQHRGPVSCDPMVTAITDM